jgi:hypothetical protein
VATITNVAISGDGPDYTVTLKDGRSRIIHAWPVPEDAQVYVDAVEVEMMIRELADKLRGD